MINWKVRIKNINFWLAIVPALALVAQAVAGVFGLTLDLSETSARVLDLVNAVFVVLTILGIVTDPTTAGVSDSERALTYEEPKE